MKHLILPLFLFLVGGCVLTGAPPPETPRERYIAAEASYSAVLKSAQLIVSQLQAIGKFQKGSPESVTLASSIKAVRTSFDLWSLDPDSPSRQQAALIAIQAFQTLLVELQRRLT